MNANVLAIAESPCGAIFSTYSIIIIFFTDLQTWKWFTKMTWIGTPHTRQSDMFEGMSLAHLGSLLI